MPIVPLPSSGSCPPTAVVVAKRSNPHPAGGIPSEMTRPTTIRLEVVVNADGTVASVKELQRSRYVNLNNAAFEEALTSTYKAATKNCVPVEGTYEFNVTWVTVH